jgi:hypothetical protein
MFPPPTIHSDMARERQRDLIARAGRNADLGQGPTHRPRTPRKEVTTMADAPTPLPGRRELAHRCGDGIEVFLIWSEPDDRLTVTVSDARSGRRFVVEADRGNALDVFYHPYAHALREAA